MQTIQHSQVLLYVLTTTGSLYSSQKSTTNNIQLIAQYKQKTTSDHSNSLLRIYDLTLAADFCLHTDRECRNSWKVIIYHVSPNNCGCASNLSTTIYQMTQSLMTGLMRILQMRLLISTWCRDLEVDHYYSISLSTLWIPIYSTTLLLETNTTTIPQLSNISKKIPILPWFLKKATFWQL